MTDLSNVLRFIIPIARRLTGDDGQDQTLLPDRKIIQTVMKSDSPPEIHACWHERQ